MQEIVHGEHTYTIDTECKGREGWRRYQAYAHIMANRPETDDTLMDYDTMLLLVMLGVVAWTREGLPADPQSWEDVPAPVMWDLCVQIMQGINATRKN